MGLALRLRTASGDHTGARGAHGEYARAAQEVAAAERDAPAQGAGIAGGAVVIVMIRHPHSLSRGFSYGGRRSDGRGSTMGLSVCRRHTDGVVKWGNIPHHEKVNLLFSQVALWSFCCEGKGCSIAVV